MLTNSSSPTRRSVLAASAAAVVGSGRVPDIAQAQQVGSKRTDLQRHDLEYPRTRGHPGGCRARAGSNSPRAHASG